MARGGGALRNTVGLAGGLSRWGSRPVLCTAAGDLSYAELGERVDDVRARLGTTRRLVMVELASEVEAVTALLAALAGGHPALVVAAGESAQHEAIVSRYRPDVVCGPLGGWAPIEHREGSAHDLHPELALLLSTSGSTGSPKLVRLSQTNLDANAGTIAEYLRLTPDDRAITSLPLHYCYGLSVLTSHLARGAAVALTGASVVDPCFWASFHRHGVTGFAGVPHTFELLDRVGFDSMATPTLRYLTQAGGRMAPDQVRRYARLGERRGWELFVMYGQTEATARMAYLPPHLAVSHPTAIGRPIPGGSFRLAPLDPPSREGDGELVYAGPNVMLGYAEHAADLAEGRTVDELWTGDLARATPDGLFEVVGRRSRFLKLFGLRLDLARLEAELAADGVRAACAGDDHRLVIGVDRSPRGATPAVAAVAGPDLRSTLCGRLGLPASALAVVVYPDGLPRLASGKPDLRQVLRDGAALDRPSDDGQGPSPATTVADLFAEHLGIDGVGTTDTFVGLGGDSLSYVEVSVALEHLLGALPPDWHLTPVGTLERVERRQHRPSGAAAVDTTAVLRAVAIVLVVSRHLGMAAAVAGGAHILFAVSGFNLARFQLSRTADRAGGRALFASVGRVAVPSIAWLTLVALVNGKYGVADVFLVDDVFIAEGEPYWRYWFVEALVQVLFAVAVLFSIPAVSRLDRRRPLVLPVALLALASFVRLDLRALDAAGPWAAFMGPVLVCFLLGWIAQRVAGRAGRVGASLLAVALVPGLFVNGQRDVVVAAALLALVWLPTLPVPRPVVAALRLVAGASLWIYLTHWQVYPVAAAVLPPILALPVVLAAGIVAWQAAEWLTARVAALARARRRPIPEPAPTREPAPTAELAPDSTARATEAGASSRIRVLRGRVGGAPLRSPRPTPAP